MATEDEKVEWIEWSDEEKAYVTNLGQTYRFLKHIPFEVRHLVRSAPKRFKPIMAYMSNLPHIRQD